MVIVVGEHNRSVRAFERTIDGREFEFFAKPGISPLQLIDGEDGSLWEFSERATGEPLAGRQLKKVLARRLLVRLEGLQPEHSRLAMRKNTSSEASDPTIITGHI